MSPSPVGRSSMRGCPAHFNILSQAHGHKRMTNAARRWDGARRRMLDFSPLDHRELGGYHGSRLFSLSAYTVLHVVICFIAIANGPRDHVRHARRQAARRLDILVSAFHGADQSHGLWLSVRSVCCRRIILASSRCSRRLAAISHANVRHRGRMARPYVVAATIAQWTNMFVLVAQSFGKIPALHALAPTQSEPPFLIAETSC